MVSSASIPAINLIRDPQGHPQKVCFQLVRLQGTISIHELFKFWNPTEYLLSLEVVEDPRELLSPDEVRRLEISGDAAASVKDLVNLGRIHETIIKVASQVHDGEDGNTAPCPGTHQDQPMEKWCCSALKAAYGLAAIIHLYFSKYGLHGEDYGCQLAWLHLLRLRYQSLLQLDEKRHESDDRKRYTSIGELRLALRDWEGYCRDTDNHYVFFEVGPPDSQDSQTDTGSADNHYVCLEAEPPQDDSLPPALELHDIEQEVKGIVSHDKYIPYRIFTTGDRRNAFDRLIHEWFLRERYDWLGAARLVMYGGMLRWRFRSVAIITAIPVTFLVTLIASLIVPGQALMYWLIWLYVIIGGLGVLGVLWRPIADIMLPRVWAATVVGYLPLLSSKETWVLFYSQGPGIAKTIGIEVAVLTVSYLYLVWQLQRYLGRSPWLPRDRHILMNLRFLTGSRLSAVIRRAINLSLLSIVISIVTGLVMMDLVGGHLGSVYLSEAIKEGVITEPTPIRGFLGDVYPVVWLLYAPFATFLGIIVQLFWQEKPITESE